MFKYKKNRDDVFEWLNKFNQIVLPADDDEELCCDICMNEEDICFKTSCCNQNIGKRCIREKTTSECPYCRKEF